jgi:transposase
MPQTISKQYDRYSVDFKRLAVALTLHPDILSLEVAEQLGIHPVMLYRWRMDMRKGDLPNKEKIEDIVVETDLIKANRTIKKLKQQLKETTQERDFLKKAKRFFQDQK